MLFHLCRRTTGVLEELARIVCMQWKQLDWRERRKKMALSKKQLRWSGGREKLMVKQEMWLECSWFDWKIFLSHSGVLSEESAKKEEWKKPNVQALCS